jgi:hypothetical protein
MPLISQPTRASRKRWSQLMIANVNMPLGTLYTHTESHDHENLRVLRSHTKGHTMDNRNPILQFDGPLKRNVKWNWTMLRDCNICVGLGPHHGNVTFLEANDNLFGSHGP